MKSIKILLCAFAFSALSANKQDVYNQVSAAKSTLDGFKANLDEVAFRMQNYATRKAKNANNRPSTDPKTQKSFLTQEVNKQLQGLQAVTKEYLHTLAEINQDANLLTSEEDLNKLLGKIAKICLVLQTAIFELPDVLTNLVAESNTTLIQRATKHLIRFGFTDFETIVGNSFEVMTKSKDIHIKALRIIIYKIQNILGSAFTRYLNA